MKKGTTLLSSSQGFLPSLAGCLLSCVLVCAGINTPVKVAYAAQDRQTTLFSEINNYWTPPAAPYDGTARGGAVKQAGKLLFQANDSTIVEINHQGNEFGQHDVRNSGINAQQARALSDRNADDDVAHEFKDGFGPVLGRYFEEGYNGGSLELTKTVMESTGWSTNPAKDAYQTPRPYVQRDRWLPNKENLVKGTNNLNGLAPTLDIIKVPDAYGSDGKRHSADYPKNSYEGSFPSGHTNKAYSRGLVLATMIPELAPEILARTSEAGNNRIVLGVHYPLDVIAGRISGTASTADYFNKNQEQIINAHHELVSYLVRRCKNDNLGNTLQACISNVKADSTRGYKNDFVDVVSRESVKDKKSALAVYTRRMTYNLPKINAQGVKPSSPLSASALLQFAYPSLNEKQRLEVLEKTSIESGYVFDTSAEGWNRINLARALNSEVVLDKAGAIVRITDSDSPKVVIQTSPSQKDDKKGDTSAYPGQPGRNNHGGDNGEKSASSTQAVKPQSQCEGGGIHSHQDAESLLPTLAATGVDTQRFLMFSFLALVASAILMQSRFWMWRNDALRKDSPR